MTSACARWLVVGAVVMAAASCAGDDDDSVGVDVTDLWVRPTPAGTTTSAVYMTLRSGANDGLVGVSVDPAVASMAMAHETETSDGLMTMDDTPGVALLAGEDVVFEPGGHHVMLEGLASPLVDGDTFELTLDFEHAPDATVTVVVRDDR